MAVKIKAEDCIACGICEGECPQNALKIEDVCVVDEDACIECYICIDACPNHAISE